jgi:hypothetical protein
MVYTGLAAHNDTGSSSADLTWLRSDTQVADLRDHYGADLVSLLANDGGGFCGIGYVMRNVDPSFASSAFQVTARGCAVGNLSYAHEHGHNMGMEHDPANGTEPGNASYPSSFGHYVDGSYRTVMSYSNQCNSGCTRVAHFSNPDVTHNGVATGIEDERENYQTANLVASTVANFRPQVCSGILDIALASQTVSTIEVFDACRNITGGDGFAVENGGDVTLIAGGYVALDTGFSVAVGGLLTVTTR